MRFLGRFVLSVRLFFAPSAQRGRCPHALRAPLQGKTLLKKGYSLDSFLRLLVCATVCRFLLLCLRSYYTSHASSDVLRLRRSAFRSRNRVRINVRRRRTPSIPNSEFRIPNYPAPQIMIYHRKTTLPNALNAREHYLRICVVCFYADISSARTLLSRRLL